MAEEEAIPEPEEGTQLLVFEFGPTRFAVEAARVQSVTSWREPTPLPRGHTDVRGVIQQEGRIVAVLGSPDPGGSTDETQRPTRVLICTTRFGHIGLPATVTHRIIPVPLKKDVESGSVVDTQEGPITFLDPEQLAKKLTGDVVSG